MTTRLFTCALLSAVLVGCDGTRPEVSRPPLPATPAADDPSYSVAGLRTWYLVPDSLTPGVTAAAVTVHAPASVDRVDMFLDNAWAGELLDGDTAFTADLDLSALSPGGHRVLFSADAADTAFASRTLYRSRPLYVTVSNDWDVPHGNPAAFDTNLHRAYLLHDRHPEVRITHFVGPYAFTEPSIPATRQQQLASWMRELRDSLGDEIGLHIHPWCSFVQRAGVDCIIDGSFSNGDTDSSGYAIGCYRYAEDDFLRLLRCADSIFGAWGLGKPASFRAGGWACAPQNLRALARDGILVDASGCNLSRGEELQGTHLYGWLAATWPNVNDTTQPYYPSDGNVSTDAPPAIDVLELPDNGILVDYVTVDEMVEIFGKNWPGGPLLAPRHYSIGYHPDTFGPAFFQDIDSTLRVVDRHLASSDSGPVVYARMRDLVRVWGR